jgi:hypothetical protein
VAVGPQDQENVLNIIRDMTNPVEALVNLLYLIQNDSNNRKLVTRYAKMAESQVRCLVEIIERESSRLEGL